MARLAQGRFRWAPVARAIQGNFDHLMGVVRSIAAAHNLVVDDLNDIGVALDDVSLEVDSKVATDDVAPVAFSGDHADLTNVTANQHHNRGHDHSGTTDGGRFVYAGEVEADEALYVIGGLQLNGTEMAVTLTTDRNDFLVDDDTLRVRFFTNTGVHHITGLSTAVREGTAFSSVAGVVFLLRNSSSSTANVILDHNSGSSLSPFWFSDGSNVTLLPGDQLAVMYNEIDGQWQRVTMGGSGAAGATGARGADGPPGFNGDDGDEGIGFPGARGADGAAGAPGAAGATGATGSPVPWPGEDGDDAIALPGARGADGAAGATGSTGAAGTPGLPGWPGIDGEDGESFFLPGPTGATGATGSTGATGPSGGAGGSTTPGLVVDVEEDPWGMPVPQKPDGLGVVVWSSKKRVGSGSVSDRIYLPWDVRITEVYFVLPASSQATATVDVKKNGTSIFGTKPTLASGFISSYAVPNTPGYSRGDYLTIAIDQPGSVGGRVKVFLSYKRT